MTLAIAYVNYDRWVADCPFCPSAEQIWPQGLRRMEGVPYPFGIVGGTLHCGHTGQTCPVVFPEKAPEILEVLRHRPYKRNRNWFPHETVADLRRENVEHGVI